MLFGLLEMVLICLKWMLFVLIIAATFLFGLGLLMGFVLVLVGVLMGMAEEGGGDEVCLSFSDGMDEIDEGVALLMVWV